MWPKLEEWRRWSALDRASYVAQLLAPVALVVSSAFSFLGWQEARRALEIQQQMFASQNGPLLELVGAEFRSDVRGNLVMQVKNIGASDALSVCSSLVHWGHEWADNSCGPNFTPTGAISIKRGRSLGLVEEVGILESAIGFKPVSARLVPPMTLDVSCPEGQSSAVLVLHLAYADFLNNASQGGGQIVVCGPKRQ
ncbi:hypothetical protein [Caulobacter sp. 602-1]|uniref:hypothetical protein n=1 Tax=Caulobacter sp. 602-1 TaxID=2492472 RepID=UPI000F633904|nr:hypothetical protein [Caulobacter sp. 602-1]RRN64698.1 hypothetical protein EIK80_11730 [Caulobacter sp. 602-1]